MSYDYPPHGSTHEKTIKMCLYLQENLPSSPITSDHNEPTRLKTVANNKSYAVQQHQIYGSTSTAISDASYTMRPCEDKRADHPTTYVQCYTVTVCLFNVTL